MWSIYGKPRKLSIGNSRYFWEGLGGGSAYIYGLWFSSWKAMLVRPCKISIMQHFGETAKQMTIALT